MGGREGGKEGGREGGREGERPAMEEQETPTWLCLAGRHGPLQPCLQVHLGGWLREDGREKEIESDLHHSCTVSRVTIWHSS